LISISLGIVVAVLGILALRNPSGTSKAGEEPQHVLRLAYFPNVTHAPALVGVARGDFQEALGRTRLETKVVNAGPEAMEALLAGEIDMAYVGPSPAINTYLKSEGKALKVLAGACSGGAALVARSDTPIRSIRDLNGKRVAVPQLGGTQDVSCRHFMATNGLLPREKGGAVEIMPVKNPDILLLFKRKDIDAAWVPEPWASRLVADAGARIVMDERDLWPEGKFTTTVVVVRSAYLASNPKDVQALLQAHLAVTDWLSNHSAAGQRLANGELKRLSGKPIPADVMSAAWQRVTFTSDPNRQSIEAFAQAAADAGYLKGDRNIAGLFDFDPLKRARQYARADGRVAGDKNDKEIE
jgi:NitT/TauT family transport system substrate-binding protein